MRTISVSVSDIDTYRRWRESDEMTLEDLIKRLKREEPPTEKMLAGRAIHKALENAQTGSMNVAEAEAHRFVFLMDEELNLPPIREMRGSKDYVVTLTNGETVIVTARARVDTIEGTKITDHKLTSSFDAERYLGSYQWRLYLSIFGGQVFVYNVFVGDAVAVAAEPQPNDGGGLAAYIGPSTEWEITEFHRLTFFAYPEMEHDIVKELRDYAEFALAYLEVANFRGGSTLRSLTCARLGTSE